VSVGPVLFTIIQSGRQVAWDLRASTENIPLHTLKYHNRTY